MSEPSSRIIVATRLHLGHSSKPPPDLSRSINSFRTFCDSLQTRGVIAVDVSPQIPNYNLHREVLAECAKQGATNLHILPVQPWGRFVPALNALVGYAAMQQFDYIVFVSAETFAPKTAMDQLLSHIVDEPNTLVVGAMLPGHDYQGATAGTSLHTNVNDAGIEEVATVAVLQKLFRNSSKCKLVKLDGVNWNVNFDDDERRKWHEAKMESKLKRSLVQLELLGLSGQVEHC
ncbi:hypothetical protein MPSEU_000309000 [Mayamaea pseudoterrestris]|nr:hypothetical protein MPSEU_000309000 [Mayamaea pseudoterrestris]